MSTLIQTTEMMHDAYLADLKNHKDVAKLFKDESIHHGENDYHTVAVLQDKQAYVVGYCDHPHYNTFNLGDVPVKPGQSLFQSVCDGLEAIK